MKSIVALLFVSIFALPNSVSAQKRVTPNHYLGFGAGFTTGYGLSYIHYRDKIGIQVNFAPFKSENVERHSLGATLLYRFTDYDRVNFFAYQGNHFLYSKEVITRYGYYPNYTLSETTEVSRNWMHGIGMGTEFMFGKHIAINFMVGYAGYDNFDRINMTAETGVYFKL